MAGKMYLNTVRQLVEVTATATATATAGNSLWKFSYRFNGCPSVLDWVSKYDRK